MNFKKQILRFVIICMFISAGGIYSSLIGSSGVPVVISVKNNSVLKTIPVTKNPSAEVAKLNESLKSSLKTVISGRDTKQSRFLIEKIDQRIRAHDISDSVLSESYYLIGIYHLLTKNFNESIRYLDLCISFKVKENEYDERYARVLYNIGLAYLNLGELKRHEEYSSKSLEIEKKLNGESSPLLASIYLSLGGAYSELQENKKALNYYNNALTIANSKPDSVPPLTKADLFASLGGCYIKLADFSKAKIYLDKAESLYKQFNFKISENYINLMNSLAITYGSLNLTSEAGEYYKKVIPIAIANNSPMAYNIVNSYSVFLANNGEKQKGEELLKDALDRAKARIILFPRSYVEVLSNYASYLRVFRIDNKKSLECYLICLEYLRRNDQDLSLKTSVSVGYSLSLDEEGELDNALEVIQSLLVPEQASGQNKDKYGNPDIEKIKSDGISLKILNTKYKILWDIYKKSDDRRILEIASNTSELIVALLEKVRINISEDDSRLILGDRYRDSYLNAIRDFNLLYNKTNDSHYLEKVFEYSEKSKVEGLLTSTRELNATQLNIPSGIGDYEMKLQVDINLYNARLSDEMASEKPDSALINKWKENLLEVTRSRDSLILIFEQKYPLYYAIKYNTHVAELKDIPGIIGKDGNYVNYILSDSILYTFIANKRYQKLLAIPVDSSFFSDVRKFRSLLSMPLPSDNASLKFNEFQAVGYRLYKILIDPVRSYIISNKIFISPDNILSYLPFETIPTSSDLQNTIMYRNLSYLMNSFDISYTYSATFMKESEQKEYSKTNKLIAFAPDYPVPIDIQSALMSRQAGIGVLNDLPFARQEAKYVSDITGGTLFENSAAKESVYKNESGKYDIIHLAMHTLLNEKDPMRSTLIFSQGSDSLEDGYLKTYEIYGIPLKAKMVVLSSCNTGNGLLYSGEDILSLARGFIYSGSQSVVMAMWEIEDKSGTEIVEMFYKNLKKGYPKSVALKKARIAFLENADQLRSHPYFWSSLVVYGNNAPLYHSNKLKITILVIIAVLLFYLGFYFWKRKYS
jgi:CHAT domain-containing protein/tetratricopeptide (TPR) repeat protein